jgi:hypothetical protein
MIEYPVDIKKNGNACYQNGQQGPHDMPPQLLQMIHKGHLVLSASSV